MGIADVPGLLPGEGPLVMGIVNVTPDSFSDGGRYLKAVDAIARGRELAAQGAAFVDVGGESTRPGAPAVAAQQELSRVLPVIEALAAEGIPVSIDTSKPAIMRAAVEAGACLVNDVCALTEPDALETIADLGVGVCLMHMQGNPCTMQQAPTYDDVTGEINAFLASRITACLAAGINRSKLLVDPGFGFGKTLEHNYTLMRELPRFHDLGVPILVGLSRKGFVRVLAQAEHEESVAQLSALLAVLAVERGARVVRVHDVEITRRFLDTWVALQLPNSGTSS